MLLGRLIHPQNCASVRLFLRNIQTSSSAKWSTVTWTSFARAAASLGCRAHVAIHLKRAWCSPSRLSYWKNTWRNRDKIRWMTGGIINISATLYYHKSPISFELNCIHSALYIIQQNSAYPRKADTQRCRERAHHHDKIKGMTRETTLFNNNSVTS